MSTDANQDNRDCAKNVLFIIYVSVVCEKERSPPQMRSHILGAFIYKVKLNTFLTDHYTFVTLVLQEQPWSHDTVTFI